MGKFVIKHQDFGYLKGEYLFEVIAFKKKFTKNIEKAKLYDTAEDGEGAKRRIVLNMHKYKESENAKDDEVKISIVPVEVSIRKIN